MYCARLSSNVQPGVLFDFFFFLMSQYQSYSCIFLFYSNSVSQCEIFLCVKKVFSKTILEHTSLTGFPCSRYSTLPSPHLTTELTTRDTKKAWPGSLHITSGADLLILCLSVCCYQTTITQTDSSVDRSAAPGCY